MKIHDNATRTNITLAAVCALLAGPMLSADAMTETANRNFPDAACAGEKSPASAEGRPSNPAGRNTIAILPWIFQSGTNGARQRASLGLEQLLTHSGFVVRAGSVGPAENARQTPDPRPSEGNEAPAPTAELPTLDQMLQAGKQQGTRYVLAGRAKWHTRAAWGFLSARTKSTCAVDVQIADTQTGAFALYVRDVAIDSTAGTSAFKSAAEMIPYAGFAVGFLSAGPKTPEEQRAVLLATGYALKPWIETWQQVNETAEGKTAPATITLN